MEQERNSNLQPRSLGNLAPGKHRPTATELRQLQKIKRESSFGVGIVPQPNQRETVVEYNRILSAEVSQFEINTTSNRDFLQKATTPNPFSMAFPSHLDEIEFRDGIPATSSNSNSMMNFFSALVDDRTKRQNTLTESKKEKEKEKDDIYKWTQNDVSLKTSVMFLSAQPFDHIFDSHHNAYETNFFTANPFVMTQNEGQPLRSQYKFTRQAQTAENSHSDFFNAMRSVYSAWKKERNNKFYILMKGITCLFLHQPENPNATVVSKETSSRIPQNHKNYSSLVMIASEKKVFQATLMKHGIEFEQFNNKENDEEAEIMEKMPILESQTAYTKSFDFANNLEIYFIKKKYVQSFFNLMLTEMDSESQFEILSEYPFANSSIFYPKIGYNGPIRLNELTDITNKDEMVEEHPNSQILKQYKIFEEERTLKLMYKLQIDGCILPLTLKTLIDTVESKQRLVKATVTSHFITEKFNLETLNPF